MTRVPPNPKRQITATVGGTIVSINVGIPQLRGDMRTEIGQVASLRPHLSMMGDWALVRRGVKRCHLRVRSQCFWQP